MQQLKRLGWVILAAPLAPALALVWAMAPHAVYAQSEAEQLAQAKKKAAAAGTDAEYRQLEDRVRALERKVDTQQKSTSTEQKSVRQRVEDIEKEVKAQGETIAEKLGINFHAFVDTLYEYNINAPQDRLNTLRVFDTDSNGFTLNQANINISRKKEDENLGFLINLDFGKTAEVVGSVTHWSNNPNSTESTNSIELREAFLTYKIPVLDGITLKGGKFVTLLGAEIISNYDNFNPNISRSITFGFGIPFTHVGLMASTPIGSMVTVEAGMVNGWDNPSDNNSGKTLMAGFGVNPIDFYSLYLSGTYGPEQTSNGHSKRGVFTAVNTIKPMDQLSFIVEATYGNESDFDALTGTFPQNGPDNALWYGFTGYAIFKPAERWTLAFRAEVFDDSDGTRFASPQAPTGATAWEITPTVAYQVTEGLLWRAEYRHDEADKQIFQRSGGNYVRGQDTLGTELIYAF